MRNATRLLPALALLLGLACDPSESLDLARKTDAAHDEKKKPDPAKEAADAAAQEVAAKKKAADDDFATCMAACTGPEVQSPTDRQTCRLTCGADRLDGNGGSTTKPILAIMGRFHSCLDDCGTEGSSTNAATCRLTCAQSSVAGEGPQAIAEPQRGCSVSCLEQAGECEATCKGNADDLATCKLQCSSVGQHCLMRCTEDPQAAAKAKAAPTPQAVPSEPPAEVSVPKKTVDELPTPEGEEAEPAPPSGSSVPKKTVEKLPTP